MTRRDRCEQFLNAPPMNIPILEEPQCVDALEAFARQEYARGLRDTAKEYITRYHDFTNVPSNFIDYLEARAAAVEQGEE